MGYFTEDDILSGRADFGIWNVDERARAHYEASRKNVSGHKPWDKLDKNDPYDAAMIETAKNVIRRERLR